MSTERINLIRSLGAEVVLISKEEGGFTGLVRQCNRCAVEQGAFLPDQFANPVNIETHTLFTAPEMMDNSSAWAARLTGKRRRHWRTIMGLGAAFRRAAQCKAFPLDPET